jgi:hypothetical protein
MTDNDVLLLAQLEPKTVLGTGVKVDPNSHPFENKPKKGDTTRAILAKLSRTPYREA